MDTVEWELRELIHGIKLLRRSILVGALLRTDDEETAVRVACRLDQEIEERTRRENERESA